jgi:hypothetical protein
VDHAGEERLEALLVLGLPGGGDGGEGAAVEAGLEADELEAPVLTARVLRLPCELEQRLVGLRAGVAEEGPVEPGERGQQLG